MEPARSEAHLESEPAPLGGGQPPWQVELDHEQQIIATNAACRVLLDKGPEELLGKELGQVLKLAHLGPMLSKGVCFRSQPITREGRSFLCDYLPHDDPGQEAGGVFSMHPAGENQSEQPRLQDVVHSIDPAADIASDGIIMVNREGMVTLVNQAFADVLGIRAHDMIGRHILKSYPNSSLSRLPVVMETGKAEIGEPHLLNGREAVVSRYPLFRDGRVIGAFGKILFKDSREVSLLADKLRSISSRTRAQPLTRAAKREFRYDCSSILGNSPVIRDLKNKLLRIAERGSNVLLVGETGTGKELFAHALHAHSTRRYGPFVRVNCAAIPEHLLESELFGYVEGAFTDARKGGQVGKFEQADGGTIFLDEISDMSLAMQAKLLRTLQEKEVTPLGCNNTRQVDMRVIAATNVNLQKLVQEGRFRSDLYYRLNIVGLAIPPLRERADDLYQLCRHYLDVFNHQFGMQVKGLSPGAWDVLRSYDFPGNIRELRNIMESAFNLVSGNIIQGGDLPMHLFQPLGAVQGNTCRPETEAPIGLKPLQEIMEELEKRIIEQALEQVDGNKLNAANLLGISRPGLYKKLQKFNIQ
ncbi:sigma-54-dependent Fis family transcriptional regulator [Desulfuromonas versatilis]|uniref:Sigma-54-dependent Fis family transcriptional regulator n=1 Tax=Desulfuromonas versatilis TaxID=2802975 RepID=A0ABM8HV36_9BACT|nr:sigma 54-interacting transcriptional regulator [Desulfuromonas versatilis]BCR04936.1 sigma-54-dependent Fis family transcriptional regulator [Desulfuromonas versatilis]